MARFLIIYLSTLVVLLPVDFAFLGTIGKKLFTEHVGDMVLTTPRIVPALLFYGIYLIGVVAFVNGPSPSNWQHNEKAQEGRDLRNEGRIEDGKAPKTEKPGTGHPEK